MASYHQPRAGAIILAVLFASGTAYVLLEDVVRHGAEFTTAHVQTVLALVGTIAAGHMLWPEVKARRFMTAFGFALLFAGGTFYIITASGARNAQVTSEKAQRAESRNEERAMALDKLADAEAGLVAARATARASAEAAAKECSSGKKDKCKGRESTRDYDARQVELAESHVTMMQARVNILKPEPDAAAGYVHAGKVFASLPYVTATPEKITERLQLVMPYILVIICELGTIVFSAVAFPPRKAALPLASETAQTSFPATDLGAVADFVGGPVLPPQPPKPGARKRLPVSEREAVVKSFVNSYRERHGRDPEPREVRQATGLPRASAFRWQQRVS